MNHIPAIERHRWFALALVLVTTAASAPFFMDIWPATTQEQSHPERYTVEGSSSEEVADVPTSGELLALMPAGSESTSEYPSAVTRRPDGGFVSGDFSADQGNSGVANSNEGFASESRSAGGGAPSRINPLGIFGGGATPRIGGSAGVVQPNATSSDASTASTDRAARPDRRITRSPRTERSPAVVAGAGPSRSAPNTPAQHASPPPAPTGEGAATSSPPSSTIASPAPIPSTPLPTVNESVTSALLPDLIASPVASLPGEKPDIIAPFSPVIRGQTPDIVAAPSAPFVAGQIPDIIDTSAELPSGSLAPLAGLEPLEQRIEDAELENTVDGAVPEPGTLALVALSLGLAGLRAARRQQ